jgi:mono/diheme cytochrome c family protein
MIVSTRWLIAFATALVLAGSVPTGGQSGSPQPRKTAQHLPEIDLAERPAFPLAAHVESADIAAGRYTFNRLFEAGRLLFHASFNGLDGVGIAVRPDGSHVQRFAPIGPKGPTAQGCAECHNAPAVASAGLAHSSVARDIAGKGQAPFNVRSVISPFGDGILQLLAQEMTEELQAARAAAAADAKASPGRGMTRALTSKGTSFGAITATASSDGQVVFDVSRVVGIDPDLVVRPMGWKGDAPIIRNITVGAATFGMGMLAEEEGWKTPDAQKTSDLDGDGVERELSVGDVTAITVYTAALETPTSFSQLAALGFVKPPTPAQAAQIEAGRAAFIASGCATCHTPDMPLDNTRFEEPTMRGNGNYYDRTLATRDPGYDPKRPFAFDVLVDALTPRADRRTGGGAIIHLYGDLKRHAMGRVLADPAGPDESDGADGQALKYDGKPVTIPADQFLTAELWGAGNTGPWLHDNRAGTLREAILLHGEDAPPPTGSPGRSEAQEARDAFKARPAADQDAIVAFLKSLRTFSPRSR